MQGPGRGHMRVVVVEDDASVRRFVAMALEDLDLDLALCADVAQAMAALRERPARLVISDLMMPGESGLVLIERLASQPDLGAGALVAVFSAGVQAELRAQLQALGVWRILSKPTSLALLRGCVEDARRALNAAAGSPPPVNACSAGQPSVDEAACVAEYFGGDRRLYESYKAMCHKQFALDLQAGDAACRTGDVQALKHLAHSLKSVLRCLGHARLADAARAIEHAAGSADMASASAGWTEFRRELAVLTRPQVPGPTV